MKRAFFLLAAVAVALPVRASAQVTTPFSGTPFDVEYQQFLSGSGQGGTYGVQVGPYSSRFLSGMGTARTTTTPSFSVFCVDYLHHASNSNGLVNVTAVMGGGDFSNTRLDDYGAYQRSAYLASLFDSWTTHQATLNGLFATTFDKAEVWGGLHAAIWNLTTGPDDLGGGDTQTARNYFLGLANDNGGSFDASNWYVLSEADVSLTSTYSGQEFLMYREVSVPEPSVILLMVTGMLLLMGASRARADELI